MALGEGGWQVGDQRQPGLGEPTEKKQRGEMSKTRETTAFLARPRKPFLMAGYCNLPITPQHWHLLTLPSQRVTDTTPMYWDKCKNAPKQTYTVTVTCTNPRIHPESQKDMQIQAYTVADTLACTHVCRHAQGQRHKY